MGVLASLTVAFLTLHSIPGECAHQYYSSFSDERAPKAADWFPCDPADEMERGSQVFSSGPLAHRGVQVLTRGGGLDWLQFAKRLGIGLLLTGLASILVACAIWIRRAPTLDEKST